MDASTPDNPDLVWDLNRITHKNQAINFLNRFESSLCVFSSAVSQLYANYKIQAINNAENLIILPDPYAWHDTFQSVPASCIKGTGLFIVPGKAIGGSEELYLLQRSRKTGKYNTMELDKGIALARKATAGKSPFLPVIMNQDLRQLPNRAPLLHLHRVDTTLLAHLSGFQIDDIARTIVTKIDTHLLRING
ncbi:hypothetical protein [Dasania marina]|uniref:hypothetical protein n=1 Tax=Dasania marina TaxID=471499 RepID=UPI00037A50C2|nr:hypothetical protein [Dasania marina]